MAKRKSPAFSFYPNDWFEGTMLMPAVQRAIYIDLLGLQWVRSGFSRDEARLAVRGVSPDDVDSVIAAKFVEAKPNWFINERLEAERLKQGERAENARKNGRKGGRPRQTQNPEHNPEGTQGVTQKEPRGEPKPNPERNLSDSDSVSDSVLVLDSGSDSDSDSKVVKGGKRPTTQIDRPTGIPETLWREWLAVRRAKRSGPVTATAWKAVEREAGNARISPAEAVTVAVENSWASFKAAWLTNGEQRRNGGKQTVEEATRELMAEYEDQQDFTFEQPKGLAWNGN